MKTEVTHFSLETILRENQYVSSIQQGILDLFHANFERAKEYIRHFNELKKWYIYINSWNSVQYETQAHTSQNFIEDLNTVNKALSDINRMNLSYQIGVLVVDTRQLQKMFLPLIQSIKDHIKSVIIATIKKYSEKSSHQLSLSVKVLKERPVKLKELVTFMENVHRMQGELVEITFFPSEVEKMLGICAQHNIHIETQVVVLVDHMRKTRDCFQNEFQLMEGFKEDIIVQKNEEIEEIAYYVNNELSVITTTLQSGIFINMATPISELTTQLQELHEKLMSIETQIEMLHRFTKVLNMKHQEFQNLNDAKKFLAFRTDLWNIVGKWKTVCDSWLKSLVSIVDTEQLSSSITEIEQSITNFLIQDRDMLALMLQQEITNWKDRLPAIELICNQKLLKHHWQQLASALGIQQSPSTLTLSALLTCDLIGNYKVIESIVSENEYEENLTLLVEDITNEWKQLEFNLRPSEEDQNLFILTSVQDILQRVERAEKVLQTVKDSRHFSTSTSGKNDIINWEKRILSVNNLLETWVSLQTNYLTLYSTVVQIKRLDEYEMCDFIDMSKQFKEFLAQVSKDKCLWNWSNKEQRTAETLCKWNEQCEKLLKKGSQTSTEESPLI